MIVRKAGRWIPMVLVVLSASWAGSQPPRFPPLPPPFGQVQQPKDFNLIRSLAFSPDGQSVVSGSYDRIVRLWNPTTGKEIRRFFGHKDMVYAVAFASDGKTVASGSYDRTVKIWDPATGKELRTLGGQQSWIYALAFAPDGKTLAAGENDVVRLWDPATGTEVRTFTARPANKRLTVAPHLQHLANAVAFSPDGKILAAGRHDQTIRLWDVATGKEIRMLAGHQDVVFSVAFSPDGKVLASGSQDRTVRLWDLATGKEIRTLQGHEDVVFAVTFSPDGKILASGERGLGHIFGPGGPQAGRPTHSIRLWDPATGKKLRAFGDQPWCVSLSFAPDGKTLASATVGKVELWDITTGKAVRVFGDQAFKADPQAPSTKSGVQPPSTILPIPPAQRRLGIGK